MYIISQTRLFPTLLTLAGLLWLTTACTPQPAAQVPTATAMANPVTTPPLSATAATTGTIGVTATAATTDTVTRVVLPTVTPDPPARPAFDPQQTPLTLRTVAAGLALPVFVTHAGDGSGRLFVVEKGGTIRILHQGQVQAEPFLDITDRVNSSGNEQGLLGLAFPPNYSESGFFLVNYTDAAGHTNIARFQVTGEDPNRADPTSEFQILLIEQPARNHNGGMLVFGPDGYLWIGMGDGGASFDRFNNGQNPATLLGKMLRLDVTSDPAQPYTIPPDNPWVAADWNGVDVRDEVWAVGLRNPWRYSFDRLTGDLWIADVGQNQYEEINLTPAGSPGGLNYGWPITEGLHCVSGASCNQEGLVTPVLEYDHSGHCSVTGGYVYRGAQFPALNGVYFYGDYCSGVIWATWLDAAGQRQVEQVLDTDLTLSSFGEDEAGELYLTDLGGGTLSHLVIAP
jgi:glucose/arabinose dehydrogenase